MVGQCLAGCVFYELSTFLSAFADVCFRFIGSYFESRTVSFSM
jgi:hypothetical protein